MKVDVSGFEYRIRQNSLKSRLLMFYSRAIYGSTWQDALIHARCIRFTPADKYAMSEERLIY